MFQTNLFTDYTNSNTPIYYGNDSNLVTTPLVGNYVQQPSTNSRFTGLTNWYDGTKQKVSAYVNDPYKAPQQAKTAWNTASLGERTNAVLGGVGTILNAYNGYKQAKLAREQFNHAKMESERNWQAQRKMTNSQLEDRQKRRVEEAKANGRNTISVSDYMAKYGV